MTRLLIILVCTALLGSACRRGGENIVLASLNRSAKIQLLCADLTQEAGNTFALRGLLPASVCESDVETVSEIQPNLLGAVTQTQTGEVALVNFTRDRIIDTNRTIPGVTSLIVGEQPTGIQISLYESTYTYVSSFSPKSVQAIPTEVVIAGLSELEVDEVRFDAGPTDLALHESASVELDTNTDGQITGATAATAYRYLYAAIPDLGQVAQIQVVIGSDGTHESLGEVQLLDLGAFDCDTVTPAPSPVSDASDYNRICPSETNEDPGRLVKTVQTTPTCVNGDGQGPRPVAVTVDLGAEQGAPQDENTGDDGDDVLLVADANQPVIHRFSLGENGATPLTPIVSGTPTTDITVTPFVPASSDPDDRVATDRYLYAVAAPDGSVLAIEYTEDSPDFGGVLPVLAGVSARANEENVESRNRVRSAFINARSIEVISPFYELQPEGGSLVIPVTDTGTDICDPNNGDEFALATNTRNMRGVFLAVSLSNGIMFFLDIYDLNAPCRGGDTSTACTALETGPDQFASIRRHRRRFRTTPTTFISIDGSPSLQFDSQTGQIDETDGDTPTSDGPGLELITCPESTFGVFGPIVGRLSGQGLICASSQVWSSLSQRWDATWEGLIPNSEGGLGLFADEFEGEAGEWFIAGDVPFCRVGVVGAGTDLGLGLPEPYGGDRVLITGELPPETRDDPNCAEFIDLDERIDEFPVWFPIVRAFNDRLLITDRSPPTSDRNLDRVKACFTQFTEYQIHTRDAYAVVGSSTGFINRVIPGPDDECVLDAARPIDVGDVDTALTGRAFGGTQYVNPLVSFQITPFGEDVTVTDTTIALLNFNIFNQFGVELFDTGVGSFSLPASMLFSAQQDQLYFVDFEAGVRRIVFSPLSIIQTFD